MKSSTKSTPNSNPSIENEKAMMSYFNGTLNFLYIIRWICAILAISPLPFVVFVFIAALMQDSNENKIASMHAAGSAIGLLIINIIGYIIIHFIINYFMGVVLWRIEMYKRTKLIDCRLNGAQIENY